MDSMERKERNRAARAALSNGTGYDTVLTRWHPDTREGRFGLCGLYSCVEAGDGALAHRFHWTQFGPQAQWAEFAWAWREERTTLEDGRIVGARWRVSVGDRPLPEVYSHPQKAKRAARAALLGEMIHDYSGEDDHA